MSQTTVSQKEQGSKPYNEHSLDALTFFLADVNGAFGPYLNVFLVTQQHWSQSQVGFVGAVAGMVGILFQTPAGAALDTIRAKRAIVLVALGVLSAAAIMIFALPTFTPVMLASILMALAGSFLGPAVSTLTLGLTARDKLATRIARNSAFDHAGNVAVALLAGGVGFAFSQRAVFLLAPLGALLSSCAVLSIPPGAIDHARASGLDSSSNENKVDKRDKEKGYQVLLKCRPLIIFALCVTLFHFANAPLLPLVGQKLAYANPKAATAMMSFCIIAAQIVMLPIALLVGRYADSWGRKPLFLIAFIVLPLRALLFTFSDNTVWLISVQLLDGVGAGIFGALTPLVIADVTRGSSHYNFAQGAVATLQGLGVALSALAAGIIVDHLKYTVTFLTLGGAAVVALIVFLVFMPETKNSSGMQTSTP